MTLGLIDEAVASGARLNLACEIVGLSARTVQRWREQGPDGGKDRRRGPHKPPSNALSEAEQALVLETLTSAPFADLSPKQIVPLLADQGLYLASESTFYRILAKANLNRHRQPSKPRTHAKPQQRIATGPSQILCWDITYLPANVRGTFFYLYLFLDIWSRKIVGWGVHDKQCDKIAAGLLQALCARLDVAPQGLVLHSDNGKPMKGSTMLSTMQWLSIVPSFSRPSVSDDNPYIESLFRHLKYRPASRNRFSSLEEASAWVHEFVRWYNDEHMHSSIGMVTPSDRHTGRDIPLLAARRDLYADAHHRHPERWANNVRSWSRPAVVKLHPDRDAVVLQPKRSTASA
jgi:transposase InsO family protein